MSKVLLLNQDDIPRLTGLSGNIDVDKLKAFIFTAQTIDIKRVLGVDLYEKIVSEYENNTLTGDYLLIYNDYLVFTLAYYTASYYVNLGAFQVVNNGIVTMDVEGGKSVEMKEINAISEKYKQMAISFEANLLDFLGKISIPEYKSEDKTNVKRVIPWY